MQDRREQDRRERGGQGGRGVPTHPPFPGAKILFHVKSENIKSLHVINI